MADADATEPADEGATVTPLRNPATGEVVASLEIVPGQRWWTPTQLAALASIGLENCPDADRAAFLHLCQSTGLDPFRREIYCIGRKSWVDRKQVVRWTPQTGIDGFRHLAEETGVYGGRVGPFWTGEDGVWRKMWLAKEPPRAARVGVIRTDRPKVCRECGAGPGGETHGVEGRLRDDQHVFDDERITWAVALYDEYVPMEDEYSGSGESRQRTGNKVPTSMWRKMPANQLAKCAEAAAVRAAFPRQAAGLYEHTEMAVADQRSKEIEESERDRQRRELVSSRTWERAPGGESGVVLDAETTTEPTFDRTVLLAELAEQAEAAGKTIQQYTTRWAAAHRKNIDDATDAELEAFLAARRSAEQPPAAADDPETPPDHGLTVHDVPRPQGPPSGEDADSREPGEGQESLLDVEDPPIAPHEFVAGDGDECGEWSCGRGINDPCHIH